MPTWRALAEAVIHLTFSDAVTVSEDASVHWRESYQQAGKAGLALEHSPGKRAFMSDVLVSARLNICKNKSLERIRVQEREIEYEK